MKLLVLSGRSAVSHLADACAHDFEDAIVDGTSADLHVPGGDRSSLQPRYDLMIVCGISFSSVIDLVERVEAEGPLPPAGKRIAYVFGAYGRDVRRGRNPLRRLFRDKRNRFRMFDRVYLGIPYDAEEIAAALDVPTRYLPMAANVMAVQARPFASRADRPIAVNAFGRQHDGIMNAICDRLNRPGTGELVYRTNLLDGSRAHDLPRYRDMFWQLLRMSRVSMAFDHFFANPLGHAQHSYVGPRWFEALAAGTVVAGRGPDTDEARALLNWPGALVELDSDPEVAADEMAGLLADEDRIRTMSRRNLAEMHARHDWRHRLADLLEVEGLQVPAPLAAQLETLDREAVALRESSASE
jgi:hypothetical protein